jgi:[protein-PII] uridylyltransferase
MNSNRMPNTVTRPVSPFPHLLQKWKSRLAQSRTEIRAHYLSDHAITTLLRRLSRLVDDCLKDLWRTLAMPRGLALVAVGGYGRGELFPFSDVDLLVLLPQAPDARAGAALEAFVGALWDVGLEAGHSIRTIDGCIALAHDDVTVRTALLEARYIAGDRALFKRFTVTFAATLDALRFFKAKQLEQQQRHARFAAANLEPNIKENAGGLRDLHTVLWITHAAGIGTRWHDLTSAGIITRAEAAQIRRCERLLQHLRARLHYLANRHEDRLLFDYQAELARQFGLHDLPQRRASEQLMQRYYRTIKTVLQISTIVLLNLEQRLLPRTRTAAVPLTEHFEIADELLCARNESVFAHHPGAIFEGIHLLQQHPELKGMGAGTLRALWRAGRGINSAFRRDPANRALFMAILRSPAGVTHALRRLNQYGILGRYLPAFGRIVGQMQHDLYHVYTVDEHILKVVSNLRRFCIPEFAHEFPLCMRLMNDFDHPEVLYAAALFHDIAKGRGGNHSLLGMRDARRFCRAHALPRRDADLVVWLVGRHLLMSAVAQKQDISDPAVVAAFAAEVGDERHLGALYLLTVADIRGTSPKVWNAWKAKLIEDLFHATSRYLTGGGDALPDTVRLRQDAATAELQLHAIPDGAQRALWSRLDTAYFLRHTATEIAWHARVLNRRVDSPVPVVRARISDAGAGLQVVIYVRDQPLLFARICDFFDSIGYNIAEAKIHTTRNGYALDTFQIQDVANKHTQYRDLISYIEYELAARLAQQTPLAAPAVVRLSRRLRHFPITPEISVQPDEKGDYRVLSIVAGDRPGLLSRIARTLTAHRIDVHTARINTLGERAEDTFLIAGSALADDRAVVQLEHDLIDALGAGH